MNLWIYFMLLILLNGKSPLRGKPLKPFAIPPEGNDTEMRVIRGFPCSTEEYPFMVLLAGKMKPGGWSRLCGGTLVSAVWVLTAAHCVLDHRNYAIMAGLNSPEITEADIVLVQDIYTHPHFDVVDFSHDISMLRLDGRLESSEHIGYVQLPTHIAKSDSVLPCSQGLIMGWGKTETSVPELDNLQCAIVPLLPLEKCRSMYRVYHGLRVTHDFLCTLSSGGVDACQGDSGGPLLCGSLQVGIVSWGIDCGKPNNPGVYTRTDVHMNFINHVMLNQRADIKYSKLPIYMLIMWIIIR